jgi:hypothetical protein
LRKQLENAHRARLLVIAQEAARITDENEDRIDMVRTAMRGLDRQ